MAIARGRVSIDSSYNYKVNINGGSPSQTPEESSSSLGFHGIMNHAYQKSSIGDEYVDSMVNYGPSNNNIVNLPTISDPSSSSSGTGGFAFGIENSSSDSHQSFLNFKSTAAATDCNYSHSYLSSSMLRFDQGNHDRFEDYLVFPDGLVDSNNGQQNNQINLKYCEDSTVAIDSRNCLDEISSRNGLMAKDCWVYSDNNIGSYHDQDHELQERGSLDGEARKRPHMGGELVLKASKKHCSGTQSKKVKHKTNSSIKDPQSLAAKNRRERISEKLNILQDLIPNGSKVDLVTMLEKAISYVKFLQLQVKVLAADEFWPTQDGKAPEVSQVKAAIDAILLSSPRVAT